MALFLAVLFFNLKSYGQNFKVPLKSGINTTTLTVSQASDIIKSLHRTSDSSEYRFGIELAKSSWSKGIKNGDPAMSKLVIAITLLANYHNNYDLVIEMFDEFITNKDPKLLEAKLLAIKFYSVALNKLGQNKKSIELLNYGIQCAKNTKYINITSDFYHHLNYEYQYLSMINEVYLDEYQRLNKKCLEYNLKLGNMEMAYIHSLQDLSKNQSKKERQSEFNLFLFTIKKKGRKYHYLYQAAILEYAIHAIREHDYSLCTRTLKTYRQEMKDYLPCISNTLLAKSYLSLGKIDSGRYFAQIAKSHYFRSTDNDDKRFSLIFLADILGALEYYYDASLLKSDQYNLLKLQFVSEPITPIEKIRFARELKETRSVSILNKEVNQFLIFCICLFITLVPLLIYSISRIRSKNRIISSTINKLQEKNTELTMANTDLESYTYASAHDIRNPLSSIVYMLKLMKSDSQNRVSTQTNKYIAGIFNQINQVENYIQGLLKYATINKTNFKKEEKIDLNNLINDVETTIKKDFREYNYLIFIPDTFPDISGDEKLLSQLFQELISNAVKFTSSNTSASIHIMHRIKKNKLRIEIIDDGLGIPEKDLNKVCDLFYRTRNSESYPGVGVGLALAKKISNLHGWKLSLQNNENQGITVAITLPLTNKYPVQS